MYSLYVDNWLGSLQRGHSTGNRETLGDHTRTRAQRSVHTARLHGLLTLALDVHYYTMPYNTNNKKRAGHFPAATAIDRFLIIIIVMRKAS